jgi:tetratricopeptide (TPR) repeat protein
MRFPLSTWLAAAAALIGACATPPAPVAPPPTDQPVAAPPPAAGATTPAPTTTAPPVLSKAEARAQSHKLSLDALELLQNGEEAAASGVLDQALALDPANELARKLADQIRADAQQELGVASFPYTVQAGDTLAKVAQAYLGDRYRFYILAKYNGISNPSRLLAGQVIRIPGQPPARPAAAVPPKPAPEATPPPPEAPVSARRKEAERFYAEGLKHRQGGNVEAAYESFSSAESRDPSFEPASQQREAAKRELVARYQREANSAFQRQDLDGAIRKWDQVLALDPGHDVARLRKAQALDLKQRLEKLPSK